MHFNLIIEVYMTIKKLILKNSLSLLGLLMTGSLVFGMDSKIAQGQAQPVASASGTHRARHLKRAEDDAQNAAQKAKEPKEIALRRVEEAIDKHNLEGVRAYIAAGGSAKATDNCGQKLLERAVLKDNINAARLLLDHGAQINGNYRGDIGDTPLHYAVYKKNLKMITFLLDNKANIEARTAYNFRTPLAEAVEQACNASSEKQ